MTEVPLPDEPYKAPRDSDRPLGVTILAILQFLSGVALIVAGIASFLIPFFGIIIGIPFLIIGLISLYIGKGLWDLESWAWLWAMILNIIGAILALVGANWFSLIISVIIVVYLNTEDIKSRFGR